jgi:ABC-2 type transport system permease protein
VSLSRIAALVSKELLELRRHSTALLPMLITMAATLIIPFIIIIGIPRLTGEQLSASEDFREAMNIAAEHITGLSRLDSEAAVQAFLFQQFLVFLMLVPVTGAMSLAAYSVVGEKQARSLEPLLATPLTTAELVGAKVVAATIPAMSVEALAFLLYSIGIGSLAEPGVLGVLLSMRTLILVAALAPLASLVALQMAVLASVRVNDPRTAQQVGVLIISPIIILMGAQFSGLFFLTIAWMIAAAITLLLTWLVLFGISVVLFDREAILTKWR